MPSKTLRNVKLKLYLSTNLGGASNGKWVLWIAK